MVPNNSNSGHFRFYNPKRYQSKNFDPLKVWRASLSFSYQSPSPLVTGSLSYLNPVKMPYLSASSCWPNELSIQLVIRRHGHFDSHWWLKFIYSFLCSHAYDIHMITSILSKHLFLVYPFTAQLLKWFLMNTFPGFHSLWQNSSSFTQYMPLC